MSISLVHLSPFPNGVSAASAEELLFHFNGAPNTRALHQLPLIRDVAQPAQRRVDGKGCDRLNLARISVLAADKITFSSLLRFKLQTVK